MYFVYIQIEKQSDEVVYCGKGSNLRYRNYNSRSEEHVKLMKKHKSASEAGAYAVDNNICSFGRCGRSLTTGEITISKKNFRLGGISLFIKMLKW